MREYIICLIIILFCFPAQRTFPQAAGSIPVYADSKGNLVYTPDKLNNRIPDYSYCGYKTAGTEIPVVPVKIFVPREEGDRTADLQDAIDKLSEMPTDENGFRGAILLDTGSYKLSGRLTIRASGIVIRGHGTGKNGTRLIAAGTDRETLIKISGTNDLKLRPIAYDLAEYIPVGSLSIRISDAGNFSPGTRVLITRPVTQEWIDTLGMNSFGGETGWLGWKAGRDRISWRRTVVAVKDKLIQLDSPITTAIDPEFGGAVLNSYTWPGLISQVGIENLALESEFDPGNSKDEDHCWMAVTIENAEDCWARQLTFNGFAGSAVAVYETASRVTVEDCISQNPVSETGGQRRHTYFTSGQQVLFQRCYAEYGYHDFSTGNFAAGPNAFVQCESHLPYSFSGTIDRWASGVLFDNVRIDGNALSLKNRGPDGQGAGWTAANSMLWQCSASRIECFSPPTATNYAFGAWGQFSGNGYWYEPNSHIRPASLYYSQLKERLGESTQDRARFLPLDFEETSSPDTGLARLLTERSAEPQIRLKDWIMQAAARNPIPVSRNGALTYSSKETNNLPAKEEINSIRVQNGWLAGNQGVITGKKIGVRWWRGTARPFDAKNAGPHITRFVPGRTGTGLTDDLELVTEHMVKNNILAIDHNYGLWYDRRRDDHEMIRRMDSEAWPPFYEQPFARSGEGTAWDGLSKYDLTKPNLWYWNRLRHFADLADQKGLVLVHQDYFQHNILEAGAHYADFPWRTVNNINATGFPEPPPYAGEKRIFMAEQFYDISNPHRRELHRQYIRQCLDNFSENTNVIQLTGEEYTGPLHFMEFWVDVVMEWENETGKNVLLGLSATKEVQDAILADPVRSGSVEIIDIKYWHYMDDGALYAPGGGLNLAPRQHARLVSPGNVSFASVYRAVSEYRSKFPGKAVIYSGYMEPDYPWAVFMGGGSMAAIPAIRVTGFLESSASMKPVPASKDGLYTLLNSDGERIIYISGTNKINIDLQDFKATFRFSWIDPSGGNEIKKGGNMKGGKSHMLELPVKGDIILWIRKI